MRVRTLNPLQQGLKPQDVADLHLLGVGQNAQSITTRIETGMRGGAKIRAGWVRTLNPLQQGLKPCRHCETRPGVTGQNAQSITTRIETPCTRGRT